LRTPEEFYERLQPFAVPFMALFEKTESMTQTDGAAMLPGDRSAGN
jgi:hypothetical protein